MSGITGALATRMDEDDRLLMAMPIWHSSPLNNWFTCIQYVGGTTVLIREYHPLHFLQAIAGEKCTDRLFRGAHLLYPAHPDDSGFRYLRSVVHAEKIRAFLADRLAKYKVPRTIEIVENLPYTPTGKIMKYKLRETCRKQLPQSGKA
jgi:acyl-CoA synthetase (AMP-forming)/AMP-acid ligase II